MRPRPIRKRGGISPSPRAPGTPVPPPRPADAPLSKHPVPLPARSLARRGVDALLAKYPGCTIQAFDSQAERPVLAKDVATGKVSELTRLPAGPWVRVWLDGGGSFAIWKRTGNVYRVGDDGAVEDDPFIEIKD
jgi:hypothetical protein